MICYYLLLLENLRDLWSPLTWLKSQGDWLHSLLVHPLLQSPTVCHASFQGLQCWGSVCLCMSSIEVRSVFLWWQTPHRKPVENSVSITPINLWKEVVITKEITRSAVLTLMSSPTSWPSTTMALNPNASTLFLYVSISCCKHVGSDWPRRLMSKMTHRLSSL